MAGALAALAAIGGGAPATVTRAGGSGHAAPSFSPVSSSPEMARILAIPRRSDMDPDEVRAAYARMEGLVYRPGGKMRLRFEQPAALVEAMLSRGFWGPISVGRGKTLIAALMPTVLNTGLTVILTHAGLVAQANNLMREYAEHFYLRRDIRWLSYSLLSSPREFSILERLEPKLIVADECQALANSDAARTKRFNRYMREHPDVLFCAMSGSVTRRSVKDYAHLMHLALRDRTPLPRDWKTLTEWAEALDVSDRPRPGGALAELVRDEQIAELIGVTASGALGRARSYINGLFLRAHNWDSEEASQVLELARDAVRRRVNDTPGVVASRTNDLEARLEIQTTPAPECPLIQATLERVVSMWERPDGELLTYGLEIARVTKHVRLGGFYRWVWPQSVSAEARTAWLTARKDFRKELREFLQHGSQPGLDSPHLVEMAIRRGDVTFDFYASWAEERDAMRAMLGGNPEPPTEWVWVSKAVAEHARDLALAAEQPLVVWTGTAAVGQEIARLCELPWYGAGEDAARDILAEKGDRCAVASIRAQGTGKNLQAWSSALVLDCPPSGAIMEQLLGRHHRSGQAADAVTFRVLSSFKTELKTAIRDARYIQASTGNQQKLLTAEMGGMNKEHA